MIKKYLKLFANSIVISLLTVGTIEICARIDDSISYGAPLLSKYTSNRLRSDDGGIQHNISNSRFEKWENNNFGFRGEDIQLSKASDVERIVCLGSSESYGLYENPGMEWPAQLKSALSENSYEVINASVVGLSIRNYLPYIRKYILPLKPDTIILVINPLFHACRIEHDKITKTIKISAVKEKVKKEGNISGATFGDGGFEWRSKPKIKQVIKGMLSEYLPNVLLSSQLKNTQKQISQIEKKYLRGRLPVDQVPMDSLRQYREDLSSLIDNLKFYGINIILTTYPSLISSTNMDQYPDVFLDNRKFCINYSLVGMLDIFERYNEISIQLGIGKKVDVLDISRLIPKSLVFFGDNVHYSDRGSELIAKKISKTLLLDKKYNDSF